MRIIAIASLLLATMTIYCNAGPIKEEYELQERCGKRVEELFKVKYGIDVYKNNVYKTNVGETAISSYVNHYSRKHNKCFAIFSDTIMHIDVGRSRSKIIYDVNENKRYGEFMIFDKENKPSYCSVLDTKCSTESEWDKLVQPYMEQ